MASEAYTVIVVEPEDWGDGREWRVSAQWGHGYHVTGTARNSAALADLALAILRALPGGEREMVREAMGWAE